MKRILSFIIIEFLVLAGAYVVLCARVEEDRLLPGTTINGISIAGMTSGEAAAALKNASEKKCNTGFPVSFGGKRYTVTAANALSLDYQSAVHDTLQSEQAAFPARGLAWIQSLLIGNHQKYAPDVTDMGAFHQNVAGSGLSDAVTASQKPYWMEDGQFFTVDTLKVVDEAGLMEQILTAVQEGEYEEVIECPVTYDEAAAAQFKSRLFADQLAAYTTRVSGPSNMVTNIMLAAEKCNGQVLLPGDIFSFNDTVGEQTAATGFKTADAILNGQIVQAYGGGICQVSSTIFAAALYANLEIVERWNHAFVSAYLPAGMDAAVAWTVRDFKISNNTEFPVRIDVACAGGALTVTLLGTKTDSTSVEIHTETLPGSSGTLDVLTSRTVYPGDGSQPFTEEISRSSYLQ